MYIASMAGMPPAGFVLVAVREFGTLESFPKRSVLRMEVGLVESRLGVDTSAFMWRSSVFLACLHCSLDIRSVIDGVNRCS